MVALASKTVPFREFGTEPMVLLTKTGAKVKFPESETPPAVNRDQGRDKARLVQDDAQPPVAADGHRLVGGVEVSLEGPSAWGSSPKTCSKLPVSQVSRGAGLWMVTVMGVP